MNPKKISTILHSQFNYYTLPVTPFEGTLDVISSDPFIKALLDRFTRVPFIVSVCYKDIISI